MDRRVTLREIIEKIFGLIPRFKTKDELLEEEVAKFVAVRQPDDDKAIFAIRNFFKAYATSDRVRQIIKSKTLADLATNSGFSLHDYKEVPKEFRQIVPEYIKDYVPLNQFFA